MNSVLSIDFADSFPRREPALKAIGIQYTISPDGRQLTLERPLASYSGQDVIKWATNPFEGTPLFAGLDLPVARAVAEAIHETYCDRDGKW